jgi:putative transposase
VGIEASYRRRRTTKPEPGHKIYPHLLGGVEIVRTKPGVGDGHHLHPDGERFRLWPLCSTGSAVGCCRGAYRFKMEAAFCVETLVDALVPVV